MKLFDSNNEGQLEKSDVESCMLKSIEISRSFVTLLQAFVKGCVVPMLPPISVAYFSKLRAERESKRRSEFEEFVDAVSFTDENLVCNVSPETIRTFMSTNDPAVIDSMLQEGVIYDIDRIFENKTCLSCNVREGNLINVYYLLTSHVHRSK